jgi:hypothetical protein
LLFDLAGHKHVGGCWLRLRSFDEKSPYYSLRWSSSWFQSAPGLWHGVRTIQKKGHNFFEYFFADVYGTVDAVAWLRPIHFAHADLPFLSVSAITEFNPQ